MSWLRRLYDWVLKWSDSKYGTLALFLLAFAESIFFPIPPDVLLIALIIGAIHKAFKYALICSVGSVIGAFFGYALGYYTWLTPGGDFSIIANFFFQHIPGFTVEVYRHIQMLYNKWDFWVIFTAGFTPIPYKVFTITAGAFDINLLMFFIASIISRSARFFLVAWLFWKYGAGIKVFIDKYFNLLVIAFTVLLIGGFVIIKYLI